MGLIFEVAEGGALDIDVNIEGKDHPDSGFRNYDFSVVLMK